MGRPPTSGYCLTCRLRRVKCDRNRPACQRCLGSGHTCRGYNSKGPLRMQNFGIIPSVTSGQQLVRLMDTTALIPYSLPFELDLNGFQENIIFAHFFEHYAWASLWMPLIHTQAKSNHMLEYKSSLALVYGYFGLRHRDQATEAQGLRLYGQAICNVKSCLERGQKAEVAPMITAIVILSMFTYAVDAKISLPHHTGISQILEFCGPQYFQQESLLPVFRLCRRILICRAFSERRRTFLAREDWKRIPFEKCPKTTTDQLFDIFADFPGFMEDMGLLQNGGSRLLHEKLKLEVHLLQKRLENWRVNWPSSCLSDSQQIQPSCAIPTVLEGRLDRMKGLLSNPIQFDTPGQAIEALTYNAALIFQIQLSHALQFKLSRGVQEVEFLDEDLGHGLAKDPSGPSDMGAIYQPAIEGVRALSFLRSCWTEKRMKELDILAPIGILYDTVGQDTQLKELVSWRKLLPVFNGSVHEDLCSYRGPLH